MGNCIIGIYSVITYKLKLIMVDAQNDAQLQAEIKKLESSAR